ncbi:putative aldo/keto reductase [Escherichia coli]|uniref:Putative aldo/keto reductase n=1 Tax=Escherichia coli TaxID=562 RepID=A0A376ZJS9_ECOLX|nr:putative aldo/keto reductase [Escherichia coli]
MVWLANPERYGQMQYRYCGKSGLRLPALSLGLWHNFGHVTRWNHSVQSCVKRLI